MSKLQTKTIKLADIHPSPENIRVLTKKAIKAVKKSIERYGFNVPILVDTKGVIIAGHTRYQALKHMGVEEVSCIVVKEKDPKILNKMRLLDNHIGEQSEWDMQKLGLELRHIYSGLEKGGWEDIKLMFPDVKLVDRALDASLGKEIPTVTAESIEKKQAQLDNKFKDRPEVKMFHVNCPNCGGDIKVKDNA